MEQEPNGGRKSEAGRLPRTRPSSGMLGDRAALAAGVRTAPYQAAQEDENRDPSTNNAIASDAGSYSQRSASSTLTGHRVLPYYSRTAAAPRRRRINAHLSS